MSDVHTVSTPADHAATERKHHRVRNGILLGLGCVAVLAIVAFFWPAIQHGGNQLAAYRESLKLSASAPVALDKPVEMTSLVTTSDGRAVIRKTTFADVDINKTIESAQQTAAAADAKVAALTEQLAAAKADVSKKLAEVTQSNSVAEALVKANTAAQTKIAELNEKAIELTKQMVAQGKRFNDVVLKSATEEPKQLPAATPAAPQQPVQHESSVQPPKRERLAQNGRIITPKTANRNELAIMMQVYKQNGPLPNGAHLDGFAELPKGEVFISPKTGRPCTQIAGGETGGKRWKCD